MIKLTDIEGLLDTLSQNKKKIFEEYFSNIPTYFYQIYEFDKNKINEIVGKIKKNVINTIDCFFRENNLYNEDLNFIANNYHKIEIYSENKYNFSKFNQNEIKRF